MDGSSAGDRLHQIHHPTEPLQRLKGVGLEISISHQRHDRLTEQQPYAVLLRFPISLRVTADGSQLDDAEQDVKLERYAVFGLLAHLEPARMRPV